MQNSFVPVEGLTSYNSRWKWSICAYSPPLVILKWLHFPRTNFTSPEYSNSPICMKAMEISLVWDAANSPCTVHIFRGCTMSPITWKEWMFFYSCQNFWFAADWEQNTVRLTAWFPPPWERVMREGNERSNHRPRRDSANTMDSPSLK